MVFIIRWIDGVVQILFTALLITVELGIGLADFACGVHLWLLNKRR